jgi:mannose-1-phosphate guanylyltransferase
MNGSRRRLAKTNGSFWSVIPAGGSGTRLWPLSRAARPKFLLPLTGETSLIQQTVKRLAPFAPPEHTLIVCGPAHAAGIARQIAELPEQNLLVEPSPKGSGPAIALAAALISRYDPNAIMGSFAADHIVENQAAFEDAVRVAIAAAKLEWLVTIGLTPTRPETGYGYIERSAEDILSAEPERAYRAERFVEKPDFATAMAYVESGKFLWNASMFIWKATAFLDEVKRLMPALHAGVMEIAAVWHTPARERVVASVWSELEDSTVDQGVMEHAARVAVVPAEMGWSDVGDWHGLGELLDRDAVGNSVHGDLVQIGTRGSVVWSETNRLVALIGMENTVVVDTPDALLVIDRTRAQDVRKIVEELKKSSRTELS